MCRQSSETVILRDVENLKTQVSSTEDRLESKMEEKIKRLEDQIEELKRIILERR